MKEISEIFNKKLKEYLESGKLESKIESSIEECFESVTSDLFREWGDIGKSLKKTLSEKMVINERDLPIQSYNAVMVEALKGKISKFTNDQSFEQMSTLLSEVFGEAPKEISVYAIVEKVVDDMRGDIDDPCHCEDNYGKYIDIEFEQKSFANSTSYSLNIKHPDKYSSDRVDLYFSDGKLRISHRQDMNPTCMGSSEGWLFNLYAAGTEITELDSFDESKCDLALFKEY